MVRQGNRARSWTSTREQAEQMSRPRMGLTLTEAENAFAKAVAADGVARRRRHPARARGEAAGDPQERPARVLPGRPASRASAGVGALEGLAGQAARQRLQRAGAALRVARRPRGSCSWGSRAAARRLTAKAIAAQWNLPLLRLDMGRIFSGLVGSSEENLRRAIRVAESAAPAVLWVDEIEKGLSRQRRLGRDRRRRGRARLRRAPHLAAGEDRAGVRGGDRQPHRRAAARAVAQGALRRDLLHRSSVGRASARRSSRSTCTTASATPPSSTWRSWRRAARVSRARRSSRPWSRASTRPLPRGRS